jgi:hypothetical protein
VVGRHSLAEERAHRSLHEQRATPLDLDGGRAVAGLSTRGLEDHLCDEAIFVDWEQDSSELPDWQTSWPRLLADGRSATLTDPSEANETRAFPAPVKPPTSVAGPTPLAGGLFAPQSRWPFRPLEES